VLKEIKNAIVDRISSSPDYSRLATLPDDLIHSGTFGST
jgi:hypothetical protein